MYTHSYIYNDGRRPWAYRAGMGGDPPQSEDRGLQQQEPSTLEVIQAASGWVDDDGGGGGYVTYYIGDVSLYHLCLICDI